VQIARNLMLEDFIVDLALVSSAGDGDQIISLKQALGASTVRRE
jgi:hypothetical protein